MEWLGLLFSCNKDVAMRAVILAGGLGTRLAEETSVRPKPMVEVGGRPLLWHIMKLYAHHRVREFVVACGYKGDCIKRYFLDYYHAHSSGALSIDLATGHIENQRHDAEDWRVNLIDTGHNTNTGGRVLRLKKLLGKETFLVTYGDGVSDLDITKLLAFHKSQGRIATVTAVRPPARFGGLIFDGDLVSQFTEKPQVGEGWINGGFMVFESAVFDYLSEDTCSLETDALERLAADRQLAAYRHEGFWQCMDTLRDKNLLDKLWERDEAPWAVWNQPATRSRTAPATPAMATMPVPSPMPHLKVPVWQTAVRVDPPEPLRRTFHRRTKDSHLLD